MLLSRYDTPESRSLFHKHCHNLEGKIRSDKMNHQGVLENVKPGVKQVFERFDLENGRSLGGEAAIEEVDQRLEWFTKKVGFGAQPSQIYTDEFQSRQSQPY